MFQKFIIFAFTILAFLRPTHADEKVLITVNKFVSHPALDAVEEGVVKVLKERIKDRLEIELSDSQGNIATSSQIARHQASLNPAFMVAIATPAAQSALKVKREGTVLAFAAVTDPKAAGLAGNPEVIGVIDEPPIEDLVNTALKVFPNDKVIGVLYNPAEVNSVKMVEMLGSVAQKHGIHVEKVAVNSSSNIKLAVQKLVGKTSIIYLPLDNLIISAIDGIAKEALSHKIALIANDPLLVDKGVLLAVGCDYFKSGQELGNIILDLIEGKKLMQNINNTGIKELRINQKIAEKLNLTIPNDLKL
jgi:putative ABC transport system substrate-binding protein